MNELNPPLGFAVKVHRYNDTIRAEIILLSKTRAIDFDIKKWSAWILEGSIRQTECRHSHGEWIGSGEKGMVSGDVRFLLDGIESEVIAAAENIAGINLEDGSIVPNAPFFLVPNLDCRPTLYTALVEMAIENFGQAPDAQAFLAFHRYWPGRIKIPPGKSALDPAITRFSELAHRMKLGPDTYLPICMRHGDKEIPGVLQLENSHNHLFRLGRPIFSSKIYLSADVREIPVGTSLYREVEWEEGGHRRSIHTEIAIVKESSFEKQLSG